MADSDDIMTRLAHIESMAVAAPTIDLLTQRIHELESRLETLSNASESLAGASELIISGETVEIVGDTVDIRSDHTDFFNRFRAKWTEGVGTVKIADGAWVTKDTTDAGDIWRVGRTAFGKAAFTDTNEEEEFTADINQGTPYIVATLNVNSDGVPQGNLTIAPSATIPVNAQWATKRLIATGLFDSNGDLFDVTQNQMGDIVDIATAGGSDLTFTVIPYTPDLSDGLIITSVTGAFTVVGNIVTLTLGGTTGCVDFS